MSKIYNVWWHQLGLSEYIKKELITLYDEETLFRADAKTYAAWGLSGPAIDLIEKSKSKLPDCKMVIEKCKALEIEMIGYSDEDYPPLLRHIPDPPMMLYLKGDKTLFKSPMIGVVGARKCSEYGYRMAKNMGSELAQTGIVVVSGMAMGIDEAAEEGALQTGTSIGILGTGVDICYPSCNRGLYQKLLQKGCIISEYGPGEPPLPYHFPRRNRLISGISYGIAVIEAASRSGSLITAQLALDYGRDVYALPGNVYQTLSKGTNTLIKQGAKCITEAEDILAELPAGICIKNEMTKKNRNKLHNELAQEERIVYASVSQEPILFEKILESTQLSYESINTSLLQLEVKGLIQRLPGERYVRI